MTTEFFRSPKFREILRQILIGAFLGLAGWIEYRQLSIIDPFERIGISGLILSTLLGAMLYPTRARALLWLADGAFALLIVVVAYTPVIRGPAHRLIRTDPLVPVDAVAVLSSNVNDDGLLDRQGTDRVLTGAELVRNGVSRNLVLTRINGWHNGEESSSDADQNRLVMAIAPQATIFRVGPVENTRSEAMHVAALAREKGWKRVALVTSPLHSVRACAVFEKVGVAVMCVPAIARDLAVHSLNSAADRLRAFQLWLYERLAGAEYRRRGWL